MRYRKVQLSELGLIKVLIAEWHLSEQVERVQLSTRDCIHRSTRATCLRYQQKRRYISAQAIALGSAARVERHLEPS